MRHAYSKFILPLKSGTRLLMLVFALLYLAYAIGFFSKTFNLFEPLGLRSTSVWEGELWRIVTYAFLTPSLLFLLINGIMVAALGAFLERVWSAKEFWLYCFICALGTGVPKVLVTPDSPDLIAGSFALIFGLLVAWGRLYGHERIYLMGIWEMSVRSVALIFGVINMLMILPCAGFINALIMLCSGVTGWVYLSFRARTVLAQRSQTVGSVRMGRLEL